MYSLHYLISLFIADLYPCCSRGRFEFPYICHIPIIHQVKAPAKTRARQACSILKIDS